MCSDALYARLLPCLSPFSYPVSLPSLTLSLSLGPSSSPKAERMNPQMMARFGGVYGKVAAALEGLLGEPVVLRRGHHLGTSLS